MTIPNISPTESLLRGMLILMKKLSFKRSFKFITNTSVSLVSILIRRNGDFTQKLSWLVSFVVLNVNFNLNLPNAY